MVNSAGAVDRYRITGELGRGGMGVVLAAFDEQRRAPVALKRLAIERFTAPGELERMTSLFEREYHTLSQLAHPNVIAVFDYGIDAGTPYYTMEQLAGESLRARSPLPWRDAAAQLRDVASALAIVHSRRLVHRDVTPHNVQCQPDGSAKLIDFGAMIPMGVAKQLVGTPPFIAPECLQSQPLDAQTDLFALGACLYFAITGRNAYPAHSLDALAHAWQTPPSPLAKYARDVPEALETLVASLLAIEPGARPRTAADVYEQLTAIAQLPRADSRVGARAYLSKPVLVGREAELVKLRRSLDRARSGRGAAVCIVAPPGLGRTRLLDAALLEASLAGLRTARADASDAHDRPLGAIARILHGLHDDARAALERYGLASVLEDGSALLEDSRRAQTLRDLAQLVCELAASAPLAIAVDDAHAVDEASLAVLASLALQVRNQPLVVISTRARDAGVRQSQALRLLQEASRRMTLEPLSADRARSLLSSLFGETPGLDVLAALCERRCLGSPRRLMESAQAAIDAGLARYEGGGWSIAGDATALGNALDRKTDVGQQLAALSADAVELLQILAHDRGDTMSLGDYTALTEHGNSARMHRALGELSNAEWLVVHGERARFRRDDQRVHVAARTPPATARRIHARLAERCELLGAVPVYATYHYVEAELPERALVPMEAMTRYVDAHVSSEIVRSAITLEALERFTELPTLPNAHPGARAHYCAALVVNAIYQGMPERAAPKIEIALREFARFTGISDYREASHLPDAERLTFALERANERCQAPGIGGLDLVHALRRQTQLCLTTAVCANFLAEPRLLDHLPDLRPFVALSPALGIATRVLDGLVKLARGQTWAAWDTFAETYALLAGPAAAALDPVTVVLLQTSLLGYLSSIEAEHGSPDTLAHLEVYAPHMPHNALSLRARYLFATGDIAGAAAARKQSELASVQGNSLPETRNTETTANLAIAALSDDLLALRRAEAEVAELAKTRPGWQARHAIAQAHVLRCEGRALEAVALAERALAQLPELHADFVPAAVAYLEALLAAGRSQAASDAAGHYLERALAAGAPTYRIELAAAQAFAELGRHDAAELAYATALRALEARQVAGLVLGRAFEIGARIALLRGDADEFTARSERCAASYAVRHNAALAARHVRLVRDAMRAGVLDPQARPSLTADAAASGVLRELTSIADDDDFYANALAYLVKCSGAGGGYLYACCDDGLRRVAETDGMPTTDGTELDRIAAEHYEREAQGAAADATEIASQARPASAIWPCVIARNDASGRTIEGVVLFVSQPQSAAGIPRASLERLATLMTLRSEAATHVQPISTTLV